MKLANKGIQIEKCPRCGKSGLLIERLTVTTNGSKKYTYRKLNVAHYSGYGISKNGKLVDKIHWCYLNAEQIKQLQIVRQNFTQNVTQNNDDFCVKQNTGNSNVIHENNLEKWWAGPDLNQRPSARQADVLPN